MGKKKSTKKRTVWNTRLEDQPLEYWANSILMRLSAAIGLVDPKDPDQKSFEVDPDDLLEEVEERLKRWRETEDG